MNVRSVSQKNKRRLKEKRKITDFEMWYSKFVFKIRWTNMIKNKEVLVKIDDKMNPRMSTKKRLTGHKKNWKIIFFPYQEK